ncbi:hypothetical protein ABIB37_000923 [Agrococcus sp. UYP10]|uniref:hypothetical protein n=1 Tax=Agrococcus sp. UYP10 TaxID=1756355 RepID=UPI00339881FF
MTNPPSAYGAQHPNSVDDVTQRRQPAQQAPAPASRQRRILGIQPVLFVGICLLAVVTIITVVLIFVGDFESQASRVVWTVVVFLAFTGLLALDLVLARRSATPLVIGVAANVYLLAVLMIAIWMDGPREAEREPWEDDFLFAELLGIVLLTILVVRAAAAGAWGLISLGNRSRAAMARVIGLIAAALLGLVGVLLTLHFALDALGLDVGEWYWRATVAAIVVTALAASITVLLYWNRRNIDWQEAEARGEHVRPAAVAAPGQQPWPQQTAWPGQQPIQQRPMPQQQPMPPQQPPTGLLPWPTYADGTPLPMGPDGQPAFPPSR